MNDLKKLNITINLYYDDELNPSQNLEYEARQANSKYIRDFTNEQCFEFFKISNSINLTKMRLKKSADIEFERFLNRNYKLFYFYPSFFESRKKCFCSPLLNLLRNNPKQFNSFR